jgi:hypothetical protein
LTPEESNRIIHRCYNVKYGPVWHSTMKLLIFLFKSGLTTEELMKVSEGRMSQYLEVEGLIQKYYVQSKEMGRVGGIFVFDTAENLAAFKDSDLAKSTVEAYEFTEPPHTRVLDIVKTLR